jgi:hypothetical protein
MVSAKKKSHVSRDDLGQKKNADTRVGQRVAERTTVCVCAQVTAAAAAQCTVLFS